MFTWLSELHLVAMAKNVRNFDCTFISRAYINFDHENSYDAFFDLDMKSKIIFGKHSIPFILHLEIFSPFLQLSVSFYVYPSVAFVWVQRTSNEKIWIRNELIILESLINSQY